MTILDEQPSSAGQCLPAVSPPLATGNAASDPATTATGAVQCTDPRTYQQAVAELLGKGQPITQATTDVPGWRKLDGLLSQEVLHAAATTGCGWYQEVLASLGLSLATTRRPEKRLARVHEKIEEAMGKTGKRHRADTEFKPHSDLCAFRVADEDPSRVMSTAERIVHAVVERGGGGYVREPWDKDIVECVFLYHKDAGFVAEVQVGHPFALYTFHLDSKKRDEKKHRGPLAADGMLDLWKPDDHEFYVHVKVQLLSDRNDVVSLGRLYEAFVSYLQVEVAAGKASARPDDPGLREVRTVLHLQ